RPVDVTRDRRAFAARVRAEMHALVRALAARDVEAAAASVRADPDDPWDPARIAAAIAPYFDEHDAIDCGPRARLAEHTLLDRVAPHRWRVRQKLLDPAGDDLWYVEGEIDLTQPV